jgi:hypothetical protein
MGARCRKGNAPEPTTGTLPAPLSPHIFPCQRHNTMHAQQCLSDEGAGIEEERVEGGGCVGTGKP